MGSHLLPRSIGQFRQLLLSSNHTQGYLKATRGFRISSRGCAESASAAAKEESLGDEGRGHKIEARGQPQLDPFGIEDIGSPTLVQGFYKTDWEKKKREEEGAQDPAGDNIKKYDEWIKSRQVARVKEKTSAGAETRRPATYGNVRLDSDNLVETDGQFEDDSKVDPRLARRFPKKEQQLDEDARNNYKISAAEYLKQLKQKNQAGRAEQFEEEEALGLGNQGQDRRQKAPVTIDTPVSPRRVKITSKQAQDEEKFLETVGPQVLDNKQIPEVYKLPLYNNLTQPDIWNILKHSILFENEYVFAINKPAGIPMHSPAIDCRHYIIQFLDKFAEHLKCEKVFTLHRLDKETTGTLLFAKDQRVAKYLLEKFAQRQIDKKYLAIVKNCPQVFEGTIKIPIGEGRIGGLDKFRSSLKPDLRSYNIPTKQRSSQEAITHFRVINSQRLASFLEVGIETGIKHQIRVHLGLGMGCPIIGDHKYSHRDRMAPQRLHPHILHRINVKQSKVRELPLHLHCNSLTFTLPEGAQESQEPVYVHANVPNFFKHTLRVLGLK